LLWKKESGDMEKGKLPEDIIKGGDK